MKRILTNRLSQVLTHNSLRTQLLKIVPKARRPKINHEVQFTRAISISIINKHFSGYAFWAIVFVLSVVAVANFFLTVTIYR